MGRNYVAWATVRGTAQHGFRLHRHGMLYGPELGDTATFGRSLTFWPSFFQHFVYNELGVKAYAAERFTYRPGGAGGASEEINIQIAGMGGPGGHLVRNTDWKSWFKKHVHADGAPGFFHTPTTHEADAAGIALYLACVLLPRAQRIRLRA
jgi:hypothetical protein